MKYDYLIAGAGFSGAVMAERLAAQLNKKVLVVEKRKHIGGNAYDEYNEQRILIHRYGPHLFHTNNKTVFDYLSLFTRWRPYEHKVLANCRGELYPIPINRITINKLYGKNFKNDYEVMNFLDSVRQKRNPIVNSEDVIVSRVGYDLFDKFFRSYTKKQWGLEPKDLSPSVCGRIPVRTNDDCRYFTDRYQFMPIEGYTKMFEKMLQHKNIETVLNTDYKSILGDVKFDKLVYTGPIDAYFDWIHGKLPYRSISFETETHHVVCFQEAGQINYVDDSTPYTRVIEHKYLSGPPRGEAGSNSNITTITREHPQFEGEPYYPIPAEEHRHLYLKYKNETKRINNVIFCGRLAEYQYYNMDQVVANTLKIFSKIKNGK